MGAIETNLMSTPRIPAAAHVEAVDLHWLVEEMGGIRYVERWIFRPDETVQFVTNAELPSPPLVAYGIAAPAAEPDVDIEDLARAAPFLIAERGIAAVRDGRLPDPEWDI